MLVRLVQKFKMNVLKERAISYLIDLKLGNLLNDKDFIFMVAGAKSLNTEDYTTVKEIGKAENVSEVKALLLFVIRQEQLKAPGYGSGCFDV